MKKKRIQKKFSRNTMLLIAVLAVVFAGLAVAGYFYQRGSDAVDATRNEQSKPKSGASQSAEPQSKPKSTEKVPESEEQETQEEPSAYEYYRENSETVIEVKDAKESKSVPSEAEVSEIFAERGFGDVKITYDSYIDGEYAGDKEVDKTSDERHPMYQGLYTSKSGDVWTIFVINGEVFANPVSYNLESELGAQLLFSETKELTSYDDDTNKYYVTIPKESAVIVKVIEKIDAEALDKLTIQEINKYEG